MSVSSVRAGLRARPGTATALLSVVGYALVVGTFTGYVDVYPDLSADTVELLAHLIAAINTVALTSLLAGVYYIKQGEYDKHRLAMTLAFGLILLFLVVYLLKIGGGFERSYVAPTIPKAIYLVMLFVHVVLSIVSVPVVLYAVVLGATHSYAELKDTRKALVGRIAATAWIVSLALGIVTYVMLNHTYDSVPREATLLLFVAVRSRS